MTEFARDRLGLPDLGFLDEFIADAEQSRRRAAAALPADGARPARCSRYTGSDDASTVVVTVDPAGAVLDVDIRRDWRQSIAVEQLAPAIFQAYAAALQASLEAVALARLRDDERLRAAGEADSGAEPPGPDLPPADQREWLAWVRSSLLALGDEAHRIDLLARGATDQARTVTYGLFQVTAQGQGVTAVSADPARIQAVEVSRLRHDALEALRGAGHPDADNRPEWSERA
jgi:hypothetical protein